MGPIAWPRPFSEAVRLAALSPLRVMSGAKTQLVGWVVGSCWVGSTESFLWLAGFFIAKNPWPSQKEGYRDVFLAVF